MRAAATARGGATWIAGAFVVGVSLWSFDSSLKLQEDSATYIALAESLAGGHGYRDIFFVDRPLHAQYPPIFPLLLLPIVWLGGVDIAAMKLLMTAAAVVVLPLVGALFRTFAGDRTAAAVVLLTATSPSIVFYAQSVMTEIPYLLLSLVAILWIGRCDRRTGWTAGGVAITVALLSVVYLTRIIGVALVGATVLYVLLESTGSRTRRIRTAIVLGVCAVIPLSLWLLYSSSASGGAGNPYLRYYAWSLEPVVAAPSGMDGLHALVGKVRAALHAYGAHAGRVFYWAPVSVAGDAVALLLAAIAVVGFAARAARQRTVVEYYVLLSLCSLLVFPGSRQQRYLVPLIPFLWFYFLTGLDRLWRLLPGAFCQRRWPTIWATAIVAVLIVVNAGTSVLVNAIRGGHGYYGPSVPDRIRDAFEWVRKETPVSSTFMWAKPSLGYILTGRQAVTVPWGRGDTTLAALRASHVDYVVVHPTWKGATSLARAVSQHEEQFKLVHQDGGVRVYQVVKLVP